MRSSFDPYSLSPLHRRLRPVVRPDREQCPAPANRQLSPFNNIERVSEDRYRVTLAVAGFKPSEIDITAQQNLLQVSGRKDDVSAEDRAKFLHLGIANRNFERRFELADFVRVEDATLEDGLLTVALVREVPDAMKPRKIAINGKGEVIDLAGKDAA